MKPNFTTVEAHPERPRGWYWPSNKTTVPSYHNWGQQTTEAMLMTDCVQRRPLCVLVYVTLMPHVEA